MNVLLLADTNPRASIAILRTLFDNKNIKVYIALARMGFLNKLPFPKQYFIDAHKYESISEKKFIGSLINIALQIGEYFLMPTGEQLIRWVLNNKKKLHSVGVLTSLPELSVYKHLSDKSSFVTLCQTNGIPTPKDLPLNELLSKKFDHNFVVKPLLLYENHDDRLLSCPFIVDNSSSFNLLKEKNLEINKHFAQDYIGDHSVYYCVHYVHGEKNVFFSQRNLLQQPGGKSIVKAISFEIDSKLTDKIDAMMSTLNMHGVCMIELKYDRKTNQYYAIECNPRFWGPLQLAIDNGVNFPMSLLGFELVKPKTSNNIGYFWAGGIVQAFIYKFVYKSSIQRDRLSNLEHILFKDIWLRKDTIAYYLIEYLHIFYGGMKTILKSFIK